MNTLAAQVGVETELGPVLEKCDDKGAPGYWLCVTHGQGFPHNLALQSHVSRGQHVVAWVCSAHGPEVP